jgi:hypothetical protein
MSIVRVAMFVSLAVVICLPSRAHAVRACAWDYRNFCGEWGIGTRGLDNCMNRNARRLSDGCVRALIAEGKVSRAEVERRRVKYGR